MNRLTVGMHVDIKRSDGRIHGAVITDIKEDAKTVNVEWFEKGETKGKEVDYLSLIKQNPTLDPNLLSNPFLSSKENDAAVMVTKRPSPTIEKNGSLHTTPAITPTSSEDPTLPVIRPLNGVGLGTN
uniref:Uncharacterized protein n=1 Tax=Panagrolaimus sp. ES5 TaxID=591445 RepID=A0AC34FCJ6_9BILA